MYTHYDVGTVSVYAITDSDGFGLILPVYGRSIVFNLGADD